MLVYNDPKPINEWIALHGGGRAYPEYCTALGWLDRTETLVAGICFHDCNGADCRVNIAITGKTFPAGLLKASLAYVFHQLKLKRLTFLIQEGNMPSINLVTRLGATHEATLRDADINGNMHLFALFPENCKIWSRLKNGQKLGRSASNT